MSSRCWTIKYRYVITMYNILCICRSEGYAEKQQQQTEKKYDLTKWKYAELCDTINTS